MKQEEEECRKQHHKHIIQNTL